MGGRGGKAGGGGGGASKEATAAGEAVTRADNAARLASSAAAAAEQKLDQAAIAARDANRVWQDARTEARARGVRGDALDSDPAVAKALKASDAANAAWVKERGQFSKVKQRQVDALNKRNAAIEKGDKVLSKVQDRLQAARKAEVTIENRYRAAVQAHPGVLGKALQDPKIAKMSKQLDRARAKSSELARTEVDVRVAVRSGISRMVP